MRVLADYAFILRDYELAASNLRLLASDYKTDKAWKRYAGVQVCPILGSGLYRLRHKLVKVDTQSEQVHENSRLDSRLIVWTWLTGDVGACVVYDGSKSQGG